MVRLVIRYDFGRSPTRPPSVKPHTGRGRVKVTLRHPRRRDEPQFVALRRRVLDVLGVDENEDATP